MTPWRVLQGDCVERMRELPDASIDAVVTDPPYGLEFMGKDWDRIAGTKWRNESDADRRWQEREAAADRPLPPTSRESINARRRNAPDYGKPDPRSMQGWHEAWAIEALRVLKPGGHLLAFGGTRTYHRLAAGIEDAGFEVRDTIAWMYGSGFPKSLDVSKAIDKNAHAAALWNDIRAHIRYWRDHAGMTNPQVNAALGLATNGAGMARHWTSEVGGQHAIPSREMWDRLKELLGWPDCDLDSVYAQVKDGAQRPVIDTRNGTRLAVAPGQDEDRPVVDLDVTAAATPEAEQWEGWGTALKPAFEPVVVARKPLDGTVASTVLRHGTGALNIDATRIGKAEGDRTEYGLENGAAAGIGYHGLDGRTPYDGSNGRWPANVVLDEEAARMLDEQTGELTTNAGTYRREAVDVGPRNLYGDYRDVGPGTVTSAGDSGGASRFFYVAKASSAERNAGLDALEPGTVLRYSERGQGPLPQQTPSVPRSERNVHPTVKPIELMRWLIRLVTQPDGTVLDPFLGSGTTGAAAMLEPNVGEFIGIERDPDYVPIAEARIRWWAEHPDGMRLVERLEHEQERKAIVASGQGSLFDAA